jgi:hypothetical protein
MTTKFEVSGWKGYLIMSFYDNDQPGEIFVNIAKEGTSISGLCDGVAVMASMMLQHGFPWKTIADKWSHMRFEPHDDESTSLLDCLARTGTALISERGGQIEKDCWHDSDNINSEDCYSKDAEKDIGSGS